MNGEHAEEYEEPIVEYPVIKTSAGPPSAKDSIKLPSGTYTFRLEDLAYTRSGDKGNSVNIGSIYIKCSIVLLGLYSDHRKKQCLK